MDENGTSYLSVDKYDVPFSSPELAILQVLLASATKCSDNDGGEPVRVVAEEPAVYYLDQHNSCFWIDI